MIPRVHIPLSFFLSRGLLAAIALALPELPGWSQEFADAPESETSGEVAGMPPRTSSVPLTDSRSSPVESLPEDAQTLVSQFEQRQASLQQEAEQKIKAERELLVQRLQQLQDRYTREAKLDEAVAIRDRIRQLQARVATQTAAVSPDPGDLTEFGNRIGESFHFLVTGSTTDSVWGTDTYTIDSSLRVAAVHAGVLRPGETGVVRVTILPGQSSYQGTTRHSVTSHPWSSWFASYRVEPASGATTAFSAVTARPDPGSLTAYRALVGQVFDFEVRGATQGAIWGTDVFTDDSPLAVAAVHSGILAPGEMGVVRVTILPGRQSYVGSTRHGITSNSYGEWVGSYTIQAVLPRLTISQ